DDLERVAVRVAQRVGVGEGAGDLVGDGAGEPGRKEHAERTAAAQQPAQIDAVEPLHGEVALAAHGAELEQLDDAGVVELRAHARLAHQRVDEALVVGERRAQALDDALAHDAALVLNRGAVDDAHAALADGLEEAIAAEWFADRWLKQERQTRSPSVRALSS